jgi:hypothetical protein
MIIPARLFELWESWKGPAELFEVAAITAVERNDHGSAKTKAGGFDDYWAWDYFFIDKRLLGLVGRLYGLVPAHIWTNLRGILSCPQSIRPLARWVLGEHYGPTMGPGT